MKMKDVYFENEHLCVITDDGCVLKQPLKWYPHLLSATEKERQQFSLSTVGLHWRNLNTDVSFESFYYEKGSTALMYVG